MILTSVAVTEVVLVDSPDQRLISLAEDTRLRIKRTVDDIFAIGGNISEAYKILGSQNELKEWVQSEFQMSLRTAYSFMHVAQNLGEFRETFAQWEVSAKALYKLAEGSTPREAVELAIQKAQQEGKLTLADVEGMIETVSPARSFDDAVDLYASIGASFIREENGSFHYALLYSGKKKVLRSVAEAYNLFPDIQRFLLREQEEQVVQEHQSCHRCQHREESGDSWNCEAMGKTDLALERDEAAAGGGCRCFQQIGYGWLRPNTPLPKHISAPTVPTVPTAKPLPEPTPTADFQPFTFTDAKGAALNVGDRVVTDDENQAGVIQSFRFEGKVPVAVITIAGEDWELPTELVEKKTAEHPAGVLASAASHDQYTPEWLWQPALRVIGAEEFDLDPATYRESPIPARVKYTKEMDGLVQSWHGTFWSNFPYSDKDDGRKLIVMGKWVNRLCACLDSGELTQGFTLVKSDCRTEWFHRLLSYCSAYAFIRGAVKFEKPEGVKQGSAFFGSILFAFNVDPIRFHAEYKDIATIGQVFNSHAPDS